MSATGTESDWGCVVGARLSPPAAASVALPFSNVKALEARFVTTIFTSQNSFRNRALPGMMSQKMLGWPSTIRGVPTTSYSPPPAPKVKEHWSESHLAPRRHRRR